MRNISWLIIPASLLAACTGEDVAPVSPAASKTPGDIALDGPLAGIQLITPDADRRPSRDRPKTLARLQRGASFVEWVEPAKADTGELLVMIGGRGDEAPIIDMTTAESLRPAELFLALAAPRTPLPDGLLAHALDEDMRLLQDPRALQELRDHVTDRIADLHLRIRDEIAAGSDIAPKVGSCTNAEVTTARNVYGEGYTASSTCGDSTGFTTPSRTYYYCNGGSDCDEPLGTSDRHNCNLIEPCDHVKGTVQTTIMRGKGNGNSTFLQTGHRIRGFAYNCQGDSGLTMRIRYGSGAYNHEVSIPVNDFAGAFFAGAGLLQERANARDSITNGAWEEGISNSDPGSASVEYSTIGTTAPDDYGIFCADVQKSLTMSPGSPQSCGHPAGLGWCNGTCSGGDFCFE